MTKITNPAIFFMLASICTLAHGQNVPAVTGPPTSQGFQLPTVPGTLNFAVHGSESVRTGYYGTGSAVWATTVGGDVAYLSPSIVHPFTASLAAGFAYHSSTQPSSVYASLAVSQTFNLRRWVFSATDTLRYLPEAPTTGLSGLGGQGNLGLTPPGAGQGILTNSGQQLNNIFNGDAQRPITGRTSLDTGASYTVQEFIGSTVSGITNSQVSGKATVTHHIGDLDSFGGGYSYARFTYPSLQTSFTTQTIHFDDARQWTRRLSTNVSLGPQRVAGSNAALVPPSWNLAGTAGLVYMYELGSATVDYSRGVRSGSGVIAGADSQSVSAAANRSFGQQLHGVARISYTTHTGLARTTATIAPPSTSTIVGALQASRSIGEYLSVYLSYDAAKQSVNNPTATFNGFNGISQTVAFGITYSPRPIHLGH